jgi:hypothetical protein
MLDYTSEYMFVKEVEMRVQSRCGFASISVPIVMLY